MEFLEIGEGDLAKSCRVIVIVIMKDRARKEGEGEGIDSCGDQDELERDEEELTCVEKLAFLPSVTRIRHGYSFSLSEFASSIVASSPS